MGVLCSRLWFCLVSFLFGGSNLTHMNNPFKSIILNSPKKPLTIFNTTRYDLVRFCYKYLETFAFVGFHVPPALNIMHRLKNIKN
jgi:hypothetical protein